MQERIDNELYQIDISIFNTISLLSTESLSKYDKIGTALMKPSWLSLMAFILNVHYYHQYKKPLFFGKFQVCAHTIAVSFKAYDDAIVSSNLQTTIQDKSIIISKTLIDSSGKFTYMKLSHESPEFIFLNDIIPTLIEKFYSSIGSETLHKELEDFGFYEIIDRYEYPDVGVISTDDYDLMTNKYYKGRDKLFIEKGNIKKSGNVIQFNRIKK